MHRTLPSDAFGVRRGGLGRWMLTLLLLLAGLFSPHAASAQTGSVSGFVVDTLGNQISGATVAAISGPSAPLQTTTAADGSYLFSRLTPGNYVFTANQAGFIGATRSFTVEADVSARLDFTIRSQITPGGVLQGHVLQRGGTVPISGARVDLTGGAGVVDQSAITDDTGFYQFNDLTTGRVRLVVSRAGYVSQSRSINVIQGRTITSNFSLSLQASQLATLTGTVTDISGTAIRGAVVTLGGGLSAGMSATTNSSGNYRISRIIPDVYSVTATAAGFVASTGPTIFLDQSTTTTVDFTLISVGASTGEITGLVLDITGVPIPGARVLITGGPVIGRTDFTNASGLYDFMNLPAGTYTLRASATGFDPQTLTAFVATDTTTQLDFTLLQVENPLLGSITGQVTRTDGTAIANVTVQVTAGPVVGQTAQTDAEGDYGLPDLPEGTYTLTFTRSGFATRTISGITVTAGLSTTLDVELAVSGNGGVLTGTVTDENGTLLRSVQVQVLQNNTVVATTTTGSQGTYQISGLAAGTYSIQFSRTGFTTAVVSGVTITPGTSSVVDVQLTSSGTGIGVISGLVLDPLGRPVQSATVVLDGPGGTRSTTTNADGLFQFPNLTPGTTYIITVSAAGFLTQTLRNIVVPAGAEVNLRIQLQQDFNGGGSLSGFVRNQSGVPVVGATVTLTGGLSGNQSRTTSSSGQFSFAGLPAGTYTVDVRSLNYRPARMIVNVRPGGGAFVTFTLRR